MPPMRPPNPQPPNSRTAHAVSHGEFSGGKIWRKNQGSDKNGKIGNDLKEETQIIQHRLENISVFL